MDVKLPLRHMLPYSLDARLLSSGSKPMLAAPRRCGDRGAARIDRMKASSKGSCAVDDAVLDICCGLEEKRRRSGRSKNLGAASRVCRGRKALSPSPGDLLAAEPTRGDMPAAEASCDGFIGRPSTALISVLGSVKLHGICASLACCSGPTLMLCYDRLHWSSRHCAFTCAWHALCCTPQKNVIVCPVHDSIQCVD